MTSTMSGLSALRPGSVREQLIELAAVSGLSGFIFKIYERECIISSDALRPHIGVGARTRPTRTTRTRTEKPRGCRVRDGKNDVSNPDTFADRPACRHAAAISPGGQ